MSSTTIEYKFELMKQSHERMQLDLTELKTDVKEGFKQLWDKIEKQDERNDIKFATKDDHKRNSDRIDVIAKVLIWIAVLIWTAVLWAILKLVIIW